KLHPTTGSINFIDEPETKGYSASLFGGFAVRQLSEKGPRMGKVVLVNPANTTVGFSVITPRWLFVIAGATPTELVGDPVIIDEPVTRFNPEDVGPGDIVG